MMRDGSVKKMAVKHTSGRVEEVAMVFVGPNAKARNPKIKGNTPRWKQDQNDRHGVKRLNRVLCGNFQPGDLLVGLLYDPEHLPANREEAERDAANLLRRLAYAMKKDGLELRYILVTADMDGKTGQVARLHHHVVLPKEAFDHVRKAWGLGDVRFDPLRKTPDFMGLAAYLLNQVKRIPQKKKYRPSRNLAQPKWSEKEMGAGEEIKVPRGAIKLDETRDEFGNLIYLRYRRADLKPRARRGAQFAQGEQIAGVAAQLHETEKGGGGSGK